jgi:hypothetical protein
MADVGCSCSFHGFCRCDSSSDMVKVLAAMAVAIGATGLIMLAAWGSNRLAEKLERRDNDKRKG